MNEEPTKVLIIEDDCFIADMYRLRLEAEGYSVAIARDGEEGLRMASADAPGFVCLDFSLPTMDGLEVLVRLRAAPSTATLPVIIVSNPADDPTLRERGIRLGALDVVLKAEMKPARLAAIVAAAEKNGELASADTR